jgi:hypothetical protein
MIYGISATAFLLSFAVGETCREMKVFIDRLLACQATNLSGASEGMMLGEGIRYSAADLFAFDSLYYFYTKR